MTLPAASADETLHDTRYSWLRLCVTLLVACVGNVGMWAVIVILPDMQAEFGIDRGIASLPYTATTAGFAVAAVVSSVWVIVTLHFAIGFGGAANFGPLIADISHWFMRRRGIAVAITASGNYLSGAIWPLLLSGVLEAQGWRAVYLALAVLVSALILPLAFVLRRKVSEAASARADSVAEARRWRCRRFISWRCAPTWASARPSGRRCCR